MRKDASQKALSNSLLAVHWISDGLVVIRV